MRDVVAYGVAEDVVQRLRFRHIGAPLSNDGYQFTFVIQAGSLLSQLMDWDGIRRTGQRGNWFVLRLSTLTITGEDTGGILRREQGTVGWPYSTESRQYTVRSEGFPDQGVVPLLHAGRSSVRGSALSVHPQEQGAPAAAGCRRPRL